MHDLTLEDLNLVSVQDIERFLEYLTYYEKETSEGELTEMQNGENGKARQNRRHPQSLQVLLQKAKDPGQSCNVGPYSHKIHEKNIIRLQVDEVARLLDEVDSGES